jgi:hypothetical protein
MGIFAVCEKTDMWLTYLCSEQKIYTIDNENLGKKKNREQTTLCIIYQRRATGRLITKKATNP